MRDEVILNASGAPNVRSARSRFLRKMGFQIAEAAAGLETVRLAIDTKPDLILVNGPFAADDPDICGYLKANPATKNIPLILICSPRVARYECHVQQVDSWLPQTAAPGLLIHVIRLLLRARSAEQERDTLRREISHARELTAASNWLGVSPEVLARDIVALRTLAETIPEVFFIVDAFGRIRYVSKNGSNYNGTLLKDFAWEAVLHPDDVHFVKSAVSEAFIKGSPIRIGFRARVAEGLCRWWHSRCWPVSVGGNLYWFGLTAESDDMMPLDQTCDVFIKERPVSVNRSAQSSHDVNVEAAVIAHTLLSPLSAISTISTFISEEFGDRLGACGREYLGLLLKSVERMNAVVEMYDNPTQSSHGVDWLSRHG